MGKLIYKGELTGGTHPLVLKLSLAENVDVEKGDILFFDLEKGGVTKKFGSNLKIAGVAAESYKAQESPLAPEYGSGKVACIVSESSVYHTDSFASLSVQTGNDGILTSESVTENFCYDGIVGGKLMLAYTNKGEAATEKKGYLITSAENGDGYLKLGCKGLGVDAGESYYFIPGYGCRGLNVKTDGKIGFASSIGNITVLSADENGSLIKFTNMQ